MRNTISLLLLSALALSACSDDTPIGPLTNSVSAVTNIRSNPNNVLSAWVDYTSTDTDSLRVLAVDSVRNETIASPFTKGQSQGSVLLLGLRPNTVYDYSIEYYKSSRRTTSVSQRGLTAALPATIKDAYLELGRGSFPASGSTLTTIQNFLVVFNNSGRLTWYKELAPISLGEAKQQKNGNFTVFQGTTHGWQKVPGVYYEISPAGDIVREFAAPSPYYTDNHELLLTFQDTTLTAAYLFGYDHRDVEVAGYPSGTIGEIAGHQIFKWTPSNNWQLFFNTWDHFTPHLDASEPPQPFGDFTHPNSLYLDNEGHIIVSYRVLGAVIKHDKNTGEILWQLGGRQSNMQILNDPWGGFSAQHDAQILSNGDLLLFDNGWRHSPSETRAVQYAIDPVAKTATMVWQYRRDIPVFTPYTGAVQRLSNGNTIIAFTSHSWLTEVDPQGNLIGETTLKLNPNAQVPFYRAKRIVSLYRYATP